MNVNTNKPQTLVLHSFRTHCVAPAIGLSFTTDRSHEPKSDGIGPRASTLGKLLRQKVEQAKRPGSSVT